jgi:hypothetical protein
LWSTARRLSGFTPPQIAHTPPCLQNISSYCSDEMPYFRLSFALRLIAAHFSGFLSRHVL